VVALFPLSTASASCTIRGSTDGRNGVWLRAERDTSSSAEAQAVLASGREGQLLDVIEACITEARAILAKESVKMTNGIHEQDDQLWSLKNSAKLVFCTWNSLGQSYSVSGVFERLAALQAGKTLEKYEAVLLDDGWQDVGVIEATNLRALRSFSTREGWMDMPELKDQQSPDLARIRRKDSGFIHSRVTSQESIDITSSTLKQAVDAIKARYSEIKHVGTWVTLEGYWNGLHPDSEISREYELVRFGKRQEHQFPKRIDCALLIHSATVLNNDIRHSLLSELLDRRSEI